MKDAVGGGVGTSVYVAGRAYDYGDVVWYLKQSGKMVVLVRSLLDRNSRSPEYGGRTYQENGWEPLTEDVDVSRSGAGSAVDSIVYQSMVEHADEKHPYGTLTDANVEQKLMKADLSNANPYRSGFRFPYVTGMLPVEGDDGGTIVNGCYRRYDNGLLEYDIVYRMGYVGKVMDGGLDVDALTCNSVVFRNEEENSRYFYSSDAYRIFSGGSQWPSYRSSVGSVPQLNRNCYVNTYSAEIRLPIPFVDTKYMVFSGNQLAQVVGNDGKIRHGKNAVTFCGKKRDSLTALLVTFQDPSTDPNDQSSALGGLAANSFRCSLIGRTMVGRE